MHTCHLYISTCAPFVDLDISLSAASHSGLRLDFMSLLTFSGLCFSIYPNVCHRMLSMGLCAYKSIQLSATDLLALASMKNAAKCDK